MYVDLDRPVGQTPAADPRSHMASQAHIENTRERILDAARRRFSEGGLRTSIREIAAAANVAKPMVFYYFESKEGLLTEVVKATTVELNARYEAALRPHQGLSDALRAFARVHRDVARHDRVLIRFLARCVFSDGQRFGKEVREDHYRFIDQLLERVPDSARWGESEHQAMRQLIRGALSTYYMDAVSGSDHGAADPDQLAQLLEFTLTHLTSAHLTSAHPGSAHPGSEL